MGGLYGDPRIKGLMTDVYPTLVDAQDAYRDDTFSLIPASPPGVIPVPTIVPAPTLIPTPMFTPTPTSVTVRGQSFEVPSTNPEIITGPIKSAWNNQLDREAATRIERHLSGRVKNRAGYQKALIRLNMTDEEARAQFLTPITVE